MPDFTLPQAYTVTNVPPLQTKIGNFSDDTLFMIFYQLPRDEAQHWAADELFVIALSSGTLSADDGIRYRRDWRWHKVRKQWMMKCRDAQDPIVSADRTQERGFYIFWDLNQWQQDRVRPCHRIKALLTIATDLFCYRKNSSSATKTCTIQSRSRRSRKPSRPIGNAIGINGEMGAAVAASVVCGRVNGWRLRGSRWPAYSQRLLFYSTVDDKSIL